MNRKSLIKPVEKFTGCKFIDRDKWEHDGLTDRYLRFINGNESRRVVIEESHYSGVTISLQKEEGGRFAGDFKRHLSCDSGKDGNRKKLYELFIHALNTLGKLQ